MNKSLIFKNNVIVTGFNILYILGNFAIQIITASLFGTNEERDAYFVAASIPQYINTILVGSLGVILVPYLIKVKIESADLHNKFINNVLNFFGLALLFVSALIFLFPEEIVRWVAPGFDDNRRSLSAFLLKILSISVFFQGLGTCFNALFHSIQSFLPPSVGIVIPTLFGIVGLFFGKQVGISSLAYGTSIGWCVTAVILTVRLRKVFPYFWYIKLSDNHFYAFLQALLPWLIGGIVFRSTPIFERVFASNLGNSAISHLGYSGQIITVLTVVTTYGLVTVLFPVISKAWHENNIEQFKNFYQRGLVLMLVACPPIMLVFFFLGEPIVTLVLEHGNFSKDDTVVVSHLLKIMLFVFFFSSINSLTSRIYYILGLTRIGIINGVLEVITYVLAASVLSRFLFIDGLAWAFVLSTFVNSALAICILNYKNNYLDIKSLLFTTIKIVLSCLFSYLITKAVFVFTPRTSFILDLIWLSALLVILYALFLLIFRVREATDAVFEIKSKLKIFLGRFKES